MARTDAICPFLPAFLKDVNETLAHNLGITRGEIENALHRKLQSCGDKKKQATQLNVVSKCAALYMEQVESVFRKNFTKFERYSRRNIVHFPKELQPHIDTLCRAADQNDTQSIDRKQSQLERDQNEQKLKREIAALRQDVALSKSKKLQIASEMQFIKSNAHRLLEFESKASEIAAFRNTADTKLLSERVNALHKSIDELRRLKSLLEKDYSSSTSPTSRKRVRYDELRRNFVRARGNTTGLDIQSINRLL